MLPPSSLLRTISLFLFLYHTASLTMMTSSSKRIHIQWFRNTDLRLTDHGSLTRASLSAAQQKDAIFVPLYCFDPRFVSGSSAASTKFGSQKCSASRALFVVQSVQNLRENLQLLNSNLLVANGKPEDVMSKLLTQLRKYYGCELRVTVHCQEEVCSEELKVDRAVRKVLKNSNLCDKESSLKPVWGSTLYLPQDLPFDNAFMGMPDVFTPFRNKVEKHSDIRMPFAVPKPENLVIPEDVLKTISPDLGDHCSLTYMPSLTDLGYSKEEAEDAQMPDPRGVMEFKGGETAALARVKDYIWDKDLLKSYFDTRNGMLGADYSTKFSPWLAHGCVSPRTIAMECRRYEEERVANKSTYWVVFELLWRDFFKFFAAKHGNRIFMLNGTSDQNQKRWGFDKKQLQAWKEGRTGYPLVDANMRELAATGFMSNRGRQNVCSFLAIDMNLDWRYGADYFESVLLDYDVPSNWGNWCAGAGMTGGRLNRFNIVKQSKDYDCDGDYVRHWIPELSDIPTKFIHEPWKLSKEAQEKYGVKIGVDYPKPIVQPFEPKSGNRDNKKYQQGNNGKRNPKLGKGQRKDMKSLKEGNYRVVGEWTM